MNNDQHLIAEAYTKIYRENIHDLAKQSYPELHDDIKSLQADVNDDNWVEDLAKLNKIPHGIFSVKKYQVGVDGDKGEYVLWYEENPGEVTYDYCVIYKNDTTKKVRDIDEAEYERLSRLAAEQRR